MPDEFFEQNFQKKGSKQESDHQNGILYIQNSVGTKFQWKLKILIFAPN